MIVTESEMNICYLLTLSIKLILLWNWLSFFTLCYLYFINTNTFLVKIQAVISFI